VVLSLAYSLQDERDGNQSGGSARGKREPVSGREGFWLGRLVLSGSIGVYGRMVESDGGKVEFMALNIKNEETNRMVRELAALKGISLVVAVTQAVQEKLEREKASKSESRLEWLKRITAITAPLMNDGRTSKELLDELYDDETGLPK
jgi:antitoxin VapB